MTPTPPSFLVRYLKERRCVLFCGSGLSAWAKLPTWTNLLREVIEQLGSEMPDSPDIAELKTLLDAGKLLEVADHCQQALGSSYFQILSEKLRGDTGGIPEPHQIVARLPFAGVVTTNYDKLLERSYASVGSVPKMLTHLDADILASLLFDGSFYILKAHGDIDKTDSLVLTTSDYQRLIHSNPAFNSAFSAILLTKSILFVGYSLNDPDFRLLLDRQLILFGDNLPARYALMSGVGKVERDVLWRTAKIRIIDYPKGEHEHVLDFLKELERRVSPEGEQEKPTPTKPIQEKPAEVSRGIVARGGSAAPAPAPQPKTAPERPTQRGVARTVLRISSRAPGGNLTARLTVDGEVAEGVGASPSWRPLSALIRQSGTSEEDAMAVGRTLASYLPDNVLDLLTKLDNDRVLTMEIARGLETLPWEWVTVEDRFLALRNPLVRTPSGVAGDARGYPIVRPPVRVLLIGDSAEDFPLPGAREEIKQLKALYAEYSDIDCVVLLGAEANFDHVVTACADGAYDVIHFAGHAWAEEEAYLLLQKGVKLFSSELRSILSPNPPAIVFLNSHYTLFRPPGAKGEHVQAGSEGDNLMPSSSRGFTNAMSAAGVGALIGSFSGGLDDLGAKLVGVSFHDQLLQGVPVAEALHKAVVRSLPEIRDGGAQHASYGVSGYSDIVLHR